MRDAEAVELREECAGDEAPIRRVHLEAFPTDLEARLVDLLRTKKHVRLSLLAISGDDVVGHVVFSPVTLDGFSGARGLGLGPIAVRPGHQRHGIGSQLIRDGLRRCAERGYEFVVLVGDPNYYGRFGFVPGERYGLMNEYGLGAEFMVTLLEEGALGSKSGLVRYGPEFAEVG